MKQEVIDTSTATRLETLPHSRLWALRLLALALARRLLRLSDMVASWSTTIRVSSIGSTADQSIFQF